MKIIKMYTVEEVAKIFKVEKEDVTHWIFMCKLKAIELPHNESDLRILEEDLLNFIASLQDSFAQMLEFLFNTCKETSSICENI